MSDGAYYLTYIISGIFVLLVAATIFGWLRDRREP